MTYKSPGREVIYTLDKPITKRYCCRCEQFKDITNPREVKTSYKANAILPSYYCKYDGRQLRIRPRNRRDANNPNFPISPIRIKLAQLDSRPIDKR